MKKQPYKPAWRTAAFAAGMAVALLLSACAGSIFAGTDQEATPINNYYGSQTTGGMPLVGPPTGAAGGNSGH